MINRRNIRVKVMQTLYTVSSLEHDETTGVKPVLNPQKVLQQHFDQTRSLLVYLIWSLTEIARYAEKDAHQRASKHLPTAEDLNVNTKIAGNEVLWKILEDASFEAQIGKDKPQQTMDPELVKKLYHLLTESTEYNTYISNPSKDKQSERKILEFILAELMIGNEDFVSHIEENYINWDDDGEMVIQLLESYIQKPGSIDFSKLLGDDKELFAKTLLSTVLEKDEHLQSLIIPKLKNWDPERIAVLDMVMMKMGVAEFLYFETIPPKVTINEYIDLAKEYSTQQSGQFVNGILDNIHKELMQQGKMQKVEYKKKG